MTDSPSLVIIGTGGHAREILEVVEAVNAQRPSYTVLGFLDDDEVRRGGGVSGLPVLGATSWLDEASLDVRYVIGIGSCESRARVARRLASVRARAATLVHPRALVSARATLGEGTLVAAGAVVNVGARLGAHVHVNVAATVSHDCVLESFVHLAPGAHLAGNVTVREGADIGIGACVIQGLEVGAWSVIGAGAAVVRSVPANAVAVGVPARVRRQREPVRG